MRWPLTATKGFDPTYGDEELECAVDGFTNGDWGPIEQRLRSDHDAWLLSSVLHDDRVDIPLHRFEEWATASTSGLAVAHLGQAQIRAAWKNHVAARNDGNHAMADERFTEGMCRAEGTLIEAIRLDPALAEPWVGLISTAAGLCLPFEDIEERFVGVHAREPFRFDACRQMMRSIRSRSDAGVAGMFDFVRWLHEEAPAASEARCLVHLAHFDYAMSEQGTGLALDDYIAYPEVARELKKVGHDYLRATPSLATPSQLQALNLILLMVLPTDALSGRVVRESINRIADRPTAIPWSYWGDDIDRRFRAVRDERAKAAKLV